MSELLSQNFNNKASFSWLFKMAWRDSRRNKSRLFLFTSSVILGIAALVAVYSFRDNLQRDIDEQAKELTGADLIIDSRKEVSKSAIVMLDTIGDERSRQLDFASMLFFPKSEGSRLVQIKAIEGAFPYYGEIESTPAVAASNFKSGRNVLVDRTVMLQFGAVKGDSVRIGDLNFAIAGSLDNAPGQTGLSSTVSPVIYMPLNYLPQTGLVQFGSRIHYSWFYKFNNDRAVEPLIRKLRTTLDREGLDHETVASRKESAGRAFNDLSRFLALAGFVALLLGCVGVGSAIHVYVNEKIAAISTLRCLGVKSWDAFFIFLIQITFIGLAGAIAGAILGTGIQFLLPMALKDFLPVELTMQISWTAILQGIGTGLIIAVLFALPSLLAVRRVSPLNAIRLSFDPAPSSGPDIFKWFIYVLIYLFVTGFSYLQMDSVLQAFIFSTSIIIAVALFYGLSRLLLWGVRNLLPSGLPYTWRQGFSNLYRPNNQTLMLIVAIGMSTALITTLFLVQNILISKVTLSSGKSQPNMALFDIQSSQIDSVAAKTLAYKLPVISRVPVITMRLEEINGQTAAVLAKADSLKTRNRSDDERRESSSRAFKGEIRATFQSQLTEAETISKGTWTGSVKSAMDTVPVSLDERYAERIGVKLGDKLSFNVQGTIIPAVVGSLRNVNWGKVQTNFRVVFPKGVLEEAPQFHVIMTRLPDKKTFANFQADIVKHYPNISVIDLGLFLQVLDELLGKISFVIRFMASFSIITGWIVLISAVRSTKNQRLKEIVLLRTMGARRNKIVAIAGIEYLFLGTFAATAGLLVAISGSWALAVYSFGTAFQLPVLPVILLFSSVILIVVITGIISSAGIMGKSPLEVLRKDS